MPWDARGRHGKFVKQNNKLMPIFRTDDLSMVTEDEEESDASSGEAKFQATTPTEVPRWRQGRRIIEIGHIIDQLVCIECNQDLNLRDISDETIHGYGSLYYITCSCGMVNSIETNKRHRNKQAGPKVFDINSKAALGMLHSGIGHRQIESFMSILEVPVLAATTMKRREREIAEQLEEEAEETCDGALNEEISIMETTTGGDDKTGQFKYDMAWQKRGSGRAYDSKSGVGTIIGNRSGKVVAYDVRSKDCRKCSYFEQRKQPVPIHQCPRNWNGSSKGMEPDVGASLVCDLESKGARVDVVIMDDDATTMARIKNVVQHPIIKWSDINHAKKQLGNSLYNLQKTHKNLTTKVIKWLQKCFSYAISQNRGNSASLENALRQIVPHAFGNHVLCGTWCGYHKNPETYTHSTLPNGRDLTGSELHKDLCKIFDLLICNVEKISPGGSTKDLESFNNMIASKAPKRCHYSASGSLKNRINCAVAQKNSGCSYVNRINLKMGFSPGSFYAKVAERREKRRVKRLNFERSSSFKKRKLDKKWNNKMDRLQKEIREGTCYESGVANIHMCDVAEIPPAIIPPLPIKVEDKGKLNFVYCDIETTSLCKNCDIIQLSAVCNDQTFDHYIMPNKPISQGASQVTGLTILGQQLFLNGHPVFAETLHSVLQLFLAWLDDIGECIFIGHNFKRFDLPRLIRSFETCNLLNAFENIVIGSVDTYILFKHLYPELDCYKQEYLVEKFANFKYAAHSALADVQSLKLLITRANIGKDCLLEYSECIKSSLEIYRHNTLTDSNASTMDSLKSDKILSSEMVRKIASSGLCFAHLKLAVERNGQEGITQLFKEKLPNGKPRITSAKRILENVYKYFQTIVSDQAAAVQTDLGQQLLPLADI